MITFNEDLYSSLVSDLEEQFEGTFELWYVSGKPSEFATTEIKIQAYADQIELFCGTLEWALSQKRFRLAKGGIFLEGTPSEQADRFRQAFPKTKEEMQEKDHYWWYLDECPGGIVWYTTIDDHGFQTSPVGDGRFYYWT